MIRALIVDDEPLARTRVRMLLKPHEDVEVIAESGNGLEALQLIDEQHPDLVFLDIQMPELDGFSTLDSLDLSRMPVIIFVTAHAEHALRAFDAHAVDYLLKPIDQERFDHALARARRFMDGSKREGVSTEIAKAIAELARKPFRERIAVKSRGKIIFVKTSQIDWIGAEGNYARLNVGTTSYLIRESMQQLEESLDSALFVRVHRSAIVNVDRIKSLEGTNDGGFTLTLDTGANVTLGPTYRPNLERIIGRKL